MKVQPSVANPSSGTPTAGIQARSAHFEVIAGPAPSCERLFPGVEISVVNVAGGSIPDIQLFELKLGKRSIAVMQSRHFDARGASIRDMPIAFPKVLTQSCAEVAPLL